MPWRRLGPLFLLTLGAALLIASGVKPLVLSNSSPSVPIGLYIRTNEAPAIGRYVTVSAVDVARDYARARHFADPTDRFIKRVAAASGDVVCARGDTVEVGATLVVTRASWDSVGRALPRWEGCRALGQTEVFLLGDTDDSFDSRYWGPVSYSRIEGVWRPLSAAAH